MFCMLRRLLIIASKFAPLSIFPHLCLDCEHLLASSKRNISVVIPPFWLLDVPMSRVCRREAAVAAAVVVVGEYCVDCCYCVFDCI